MTSKKLGYKKILNESDLINGVSDQIWSVQKIFTRKVEITGERTYKLFLKTMIVKIWDLSTLKWRPRVPSYDVTIKWFKLGMTSLLLNGWSSLQRSESADATEIWSSFSTSTVEPTDKSWMAFVAVWTSSSVLSVAALTVEVSSLIAVAVETSFSMTDNKIEMPWNKNHYHS